MSSYLKFLSRNKLYTVIEAMGLAVSLAFVILIGSYVVQQYQVAHEAPEWEDVYALHGGDYIGLTYWDKEEVLMNIPEAASATHTAIRWKPVIKFGEDLIYLKKWKIYVQEDKNRFVHLINRFVHHRIIIYQYLCARLFQILTNSN